MPNLKKFLTTTVAAATICTLGGAALVSAEGKGKPTKPEAKTCLAGKKGGKQGLSVIGLTSDTRLICFQENAPGAAKDLGKITGLAGDTYLLGIDFRPANGELVGLGDKGGVYALNPMDASATKKSQLDVALSGTSFGIDFNPTVDRLRVVSDNGQNLRINVDTGMTTVDGTLSATPAPAAPVPSAGIVGAAYTNNDSDAGTATTLFDIDSALDQVAIQAPPNAGGLNPTGKLGVDTGAMVGSDIYTTTANGSAVGNQAFASLSLGQQTAFYSVDLLTGKATKRGLFGWPNQVVGIAIPVNQG